MLEPFYFPKDWKDAPAAERLDWIDRARRIIQIESDKAYKELMKK